VIAPATHPLTSHPELVSGSIAPRFPEPAGLARPRGWVAPRPSAPCQAETWILKQVQDDEEGRTGRATERGAVKTSPMIAAATLAASCRNRPSPSKGRG